MHTVTGLLVVLAVILLAAACGGEAQKPTATPTAAATATPLVYPVQTFPDQGQEHIRPGLPLVQYNSNPPTSGPHSPAVAQWGVHDSPPPKEALVHNMEHSGVVVWYNCRGGRQPLDERQCHQLRDNLSRVVRRFLNEGKLIVMTPYAEMEQRIALTAWTKLDAFDEFDEARVASFIQQYEGAFDPEGFRGRPSR